MPSGANQIDPNYREVDSSERRLHSRFLFPAQVPHILKIRDDYENLPTLDHSLPRRAPDRAPIREAIWEAFRKPLIAGTASQTAGSEDLLFASAGNWVNIRRSWGKV